jgi:hypothetical protein
VAVDAKPCRAVLRALNPTWKRKVASHGTIARRAGVVSQGLGCRRVDKRRPFRMLKCNLLLCFPHDYSRASLAHRTESPADTAEPARPYLRIIQLDRAENVNAAARAD